MELSVALKLLYLQIMEALHFFQQVFINGPCTRACGTHTYKQCIHAKTHAMICLEGLLLWWTECWAHIFEEEACGISMTDAVVWICACLVVESCAFIGFFGH